MRAVSILTAAQQGAAPDRLQLRSFRSFLTSFSSLPAAGELVVVLPRLVRHFAKGDSSYALTR